PRRAGRDVRAGPGRAGVLPAQLSLGRPVPAGRPPVRVAGAGGSRRLRAVHRVPPRPPPPPPGPLAPLASLRSPARLAGPARSPSTERMIRVVPAIAGSRPFHITRPAGS